MMVRSHGEMRGMVRIGEGLMPPRKKTPVRLCKDHRRPVRMEGEGWDERMICPEGDHTVPEESFYLGDPDTATIIDTAARDPKVNKPRARRERSQHSPDPPIVYELQALARGRSRSGPAHAAAQKAQRIAKLEKTEKHHLAIADRFRLKAAAVRATITRIESEG